MEEKNENNIEATEAHNVYQTALEEPQEKVETFSNQTITKIQSPKKNKTWIFVGVGVIVALAILCFLFYLLKNNPRYTLVKSLDTWGQSFEKLTKHVNQIEIDVYEKETVKINGKMNINAPILLENVEPEEKESVEAFLNLLNRLRLDMDVRANRKEKIMYVGFKGNLEDDVLFDLEVINQDNNQYLLLRNVLERYLDLGEYEVFKEDDYVQDSKYLNEETEYTWRVIKRSIQKNLRPSYIKTGKEKITVGEKNKTVKTTTLVLNEKNLTELMSNVVKDLQKNKRTKAFLISLYPEFEDYEVEVSEDTEDPLLYTVYTERGKIVQISLHDEEDKIVYIPGSNVDTFELIENEEVIVRAYLKEESNGFEFVVKDLKNESNNMTLVQTVENDEINYRLDLKVEEVEVTALYKTVIKDIKKNESYDADVELSIDAKYQGKEALTIALDMSTSISNKADIKPVEDAVSIDDITEEEQIKILSYLENVINLLGLE